MTFTGHHLNASSDLLTYMRSYAMPAFGALVMVVGMAYVLGQGARRFAAFVGAAMEKSSLTQDYVSRAAEIPPNKLSEMLGAKAPFTVAYRILGSEEVWNETDFWDEFLRVAAESRGLAVVPKDVGTLIDRFDAYLGHKPMQRMQLPDERDDEEKAS